MASAQTPAQDYPVKPITIIVGFAPGGNADLRMRHFAPVLSSILGKPVLVENKAGAGGNIGTDFVAKAAPDGYTIGTGSFGPLGVNRALFANLPYDPIKDLAPVVLIEKGPLVLVSNLERPFKSVVDVINAARARPGELSIANAGPGGSHHLSAELFMQSLGLKLINVPFKGGAPAATALIGGQVDLMFEQTYAALPSIQSGRTRPLAVTSDKRIAALPQVPTFAELGYPKVEVFNWMGIIAPKATPPAILAKLNAAFAKALVHPELRAKMLAQNNAPGGGAPEEFGALIASELEKWTGVVRAAGIKSE